MEPKKTRRCLNNILQAMTEKVSTGEDSELGHCLGHLPMFISIWVQGRLQGYEFLSSKDSELLRLLRRGLTNHQFRCMVVPGAVSVRVVNPSRSVDERDKSEEFWRMGQENEERIKGFLDQITDFRRSIAGEDFRQYYLLMWTFCRKDTLLAEDTPLVL